MVVLAVCWRWLSTPMSSGENEERRGEDGEVYSLYVVSPEPSCASRLATPWEPRARTHKMLCESPRLSSGRAVSQYLVCECARARSPWHRPNEAGARLQCRHRLMVDCEVKRGGERCARLGATV